MNQNESIKEKIFKMDREIKEMLDTICVMEMFYSTLGENLTEEDKENYAAMMHIKDKLVPLMATRKMIGDLYFLTTGEIIVPCWEN